MGPENPREALEGQWEELPSLPQRELASSPLLQHGSGSGQQDEGGLPSDDWKEEHSLKRSSNAAQRPMTAAQGLSLPLAPPAFDRPCAAQEGDSDDWKVGGSAENGGGLIQSALQHAVLGVRSPALDMS